MSRLTELASLRMREMILLSETCADPRCGHELRNHRQTQWPADTTPPCMPLRGARCKCDGFKDTADERLPGLA